MAPKGNTFMQIVVNDNTQKSYKFEIHAVLSFMRCRGVQKKSPC